MTKETKNNNSSLTIEDIATFCKKKGFVYPSSEIYGGISGFWDFGPLGVELFNNIKKHFWKFFVQDREDMVGIDASIISNPKIWEASGHLSSFGDIVLTCSKCKNKLRADHYIEEKLSINVEGMDIKEISRIISENNLVCPKCSGNFEELKNFNLLFETRVGAEEGKKGKAYLRGETAQGMFTDFKLVADTTRQKLPFGIAQIGKCFRNEISPRDFLFRSREFHIGEFEFFIRPGDDDCQLLDKKHKEVKLKLLDAETQEENKKTLKETTISRMISEGRIGNWHGYWLAEQILWLKELGLNMDKFKCREHTKKELSHYSSGTFDLDYEYPFGSKEIAGNADRGQYDLNQHIRFSKQKLALFDEESKEKVVPRVIEPTFGMERVFLAVLVDAYTDDKERGNIVLRIKPELAPIKVAVFPLVNKLDEKARQLYDMLRKEFVCFYDKSGSVGRRYARQDEIGTPYCITYDFESLEDNCVTIRNRDTTEQKRVRISELAGLLNELIRGRKRFDDI